MSPGRSLCLATELVRQFSVVVIWTATVCVKGGGSVVI